MVVLRNQTPMEKCILTKEVNADNGHITESVLNTSLADITAVGLVNIIKRVSMNLEEKMENILRDVKQKVEQVEKRVKSSADYGKVLLSHQKRLESIANKGRQNNLIITGVAEEDQKDDVETTQDVISQILTEHI